MNPKYYFVLIFLFGLLSNCEFESEEEVLIINVPSHLQSSEPNLLLGNDDSLYLSWIETDSLENSKLVFSKYNDDGYWNEPITIANGNNWFVNWADFPSLSAFGETNLVTHYLEKSASDTYAYDVKLSISKNKGVSWDASFSPHNDKTNTEHGFVSKLGLDDDHFMVVWLDGRQYAYAEKDSTIQKQMSLRSAIIDVNGKLIEEHIIDSRVCDCCQTDLTMTKEGPIVIYRDRSDSEIRDIYFSKFINNEWTEPMTVHDDNWKIFGCPVNGPAIASRSKLTAMSWFTMADEMPKVKVSFINDDDSSFSAPVLMDFINPLGRVDIEFIDDSRVIASWMDSSDGITKIQLQAVGEDRQKGPIFTVSEISDERSSGFPKMVVKDNFVYMTWTEVNPQLRVKTARIAIKNIK